MLRYWAGSTQLQVSAQADGLANQRHAAAPTLLTGSNGYAAPVGKFFGLPFTAQAQHAALGHQGRDAGHTQFGGFFNQPVHTVIGGHADGNVHLPGGLSVCVHKAAHRHVHVAAAHGLHDCGVLAFCFAKPIEQRDGVTRLHAQHLHVARG